MRRATGQLWLWRSAVLQHNWEVTIDHDNSTSDQVPRSFIIIAFGPLVGALVVLGAIIVSNFLAGAPPPARDLGQAIGMGFALVFSVGWIAGLVPAILAAIIWHFVAPHLTGWRRVPTAFAIGALSGMVAGWPIFMVFSRSPRVPPQGWAMLAIVGALAMAATALPGKKSVLRS